MRTRFGHLRRPSRAVLEASEPKQHELLTFLTHVLLNALLQVKRKWQRFLWSIVYIMAGIGCAGSTAFLIDPVVSPIAVKFVIVDVMHSLTCVAFAFGDGSAPVLSTSRTARRTALK